MSEQEFSALTAGEPSLLSRVEEIVLEAHRRVYEGQGWEWSKPVAYSWLRYEDPLPVARLRDGVEKLERLGGEFDPDAVDKACTTALTRGFSY